MKKGHIIGFIFTMALMLVIVLGMNVEAKENKEDQFEGTLVDGKKQGFGILSYADGDQYKGSWYNDVAQGPGVFYYSDGDCIAGCTYNGKMEGIAVFIRADGHVGGLHTYKNGKLDGVQVYFDEDGRVSGTSVYKDNNPTDIQLTTWQKNGITYYAESKEELNGGKGVAVHHHDDSDNVYIGEFIDGKREGQGTFYWANDGWFTGNWKNGKQDGVGCQYYLPLQKTETSVMYYKGTWESGEKKGFGIKYSSDGSRFLCIRENNDIINGYAVTIGADGTITPSEWENGEKKSEGFSKSWKDSDGHLYLGSKKGNVLDGYGLCIYNDNTIYIGEYADQKREGSGAYYWTDSDQYYEGQFKDWRLDGAGVLCGYIDDCYGYYVGESADGMRQGEGTFTCGDGSWYEGTWKEGSYDSGSYVYPLRNGNMNVTVFNNGKENKADVGVTMYMDFDYDGKYAIFEPGEYTVADIVKRGLSINSISSMEIPDGYSVTLYHVSDLTGTGEEFTEDAEQLNTKWNDRIASFQVRKK